jgi:hypothetical protein
MTNPQWAELIQDYAQVAFWFRKTAEQGNTPPQIQLGILYEFEFGAEIWWSGLTLWEKKSYG